MNARLMAAMPLLMLSVPAMGQNPSTRSPSAAKGAGDVVVTGRRLADTEAALNACIARHCPPDEDIRATLAHAENQFVGGGYKDARRTLIASQGRNKGQARQYPVPVGDLYRASSRVAAHLGETDSFRVNALDSLDALKAGLASDDPRVLAQRVEVGDMFAKLDRPIAALQIYGQVAKQARTLRLPGMEAAARIRALALEVAMAETAQAQGAGWRSALPAFDRLIGEREPRLATMAYVARVMKAQFLARHGEPAQIDAVMAEMRAKGGQVRPVLLSSAPIDLPQRTDVNAVADEVVAQDVLTRTPMSSFVDQWIDVSFWIRPDGTAGDVDVLRTGKDADKGWSKPVLASIATRRYAPLALPADDPGLLRVERYSYTSFFDDSITGTRIRTRSGVPRIEMLDLTAESERAAASRPSRIVDPS